MTDDDRMDALMRQMAADEYNRPPQIVPREQMWDAVQAGLRAGDHSAEGAVVPLSPVSRVPRWVYFAAAAVLLLAAGIQIGRQMGGSAVQRPPIAGVPESVTPRDSAALPTGGSAVVAPEPRTDVAVVPRTDNNGRPPRPGPRDPERGTPAMPNETAASAYSVVATQHLTEAEAMLTAFRGDLNQGRMDAQIASWGKDLLSNTRLLLDSPAARDPVRRKLFQDLELILVQIVQLSPGSPARDRDLIEGALTDDQVLTRLRTALPLQKGT